MSVLPFLPYIMIRPDADIVKYFFWCKLCNYVMSLLPFLPYITIRPDKPALSVFIFRNLLYLELNLSFC